MVKLKIEDFFILNNCAHLLFIILIYVCFVPLKVLMRGLQTCVNSILITKVRYETYYLNFKIYIDPNSTNLILGNNNV